MSRALTETEMRSIVRAHPAVFREIVAAAKGTHDETAKAVTMVLFRRQEVIDSILAAAGLQPPGTGLVASVLRVFMVGPVIQATRAAHSAEAMVAIFTEEAARASLDNVDAKLARLFFTGEDR